MKLNIYNKIEVKFHVLVHNFYSSGQCLYQQVVYCYLLIANFILIVSKPENQPKLKMEDKQARRYIRF